LRTSKVRVRVSARSISLIGLIIVGLSRVAATQSLVSAEDLPAAIRLLDNAPAHKSLPCTISADKWPRLDFLLRYTFGFGVDCRLGEIQPGEKLIAIVRVKPTKDAPAVMVEEFDVPPFPPEQLTGFYAKKLSDVRISMSGGFAVGVGRYSAEVVLTDEHGHHVPQAVELQRWKQKTGTYLAIDTSAKQGRTSIGSNVEWQTQREWRPFDSSVPSRSSLRR